MSSPFHHNFFFCSVFFFPYFNYLWHACLTFNFGRRNLLTGISLSCVYLRFFTFFPRLFTFISVCFRLFSLNFCFFPFLSVLCNLYTILFHSSNKYLLLVFILILFSSFFFACLSRFFLSFLSLFRITISTSFSFSFPSSSPPPFCVSSTSSIWQILSQFLCAVPWLFYQLSKLHTSIPICTCIRKHTHIHTLTIT